MSLLAYSLGYSHICMEHPIHFCTWLYIIISVTVPHKRKRKNELIFSIRYLFKFAGYNSLGMQRAIGNKVNVIVRFKTNNELTTSNVIETLQITSHS